MTNNENKVKEPLFHITKRAAMPWKKAWGIRLIAIFASLIFCGLLSLIVIEHTDVCGQLTKIGRLELTFFQFEYDKTLQFSVEE